MGAYRRLTAGLSVFEMGEGLDLDQYVTGKALDGLFFMLAQQEVPTSAAIRLRDRSSKEGVLGAQIMRWAQ